MPPKPTGGKQHMAAKDWSISAQWIVPGTGRAIRDAVMRCRGASIEAIGRLGRVPPSAHHTDLGEVVVLPGLVNAHTHLELTHMRGQLPRRRPMPQWLFALMRRRLTGTAQAGSIIDGAEEALATGTTALADICHNHRAWKILKDSPLRKLCFAEIVGIGPASLGAMSKLLGRVKGCRSGARIRFGISPHAPYSTGIDIYRQAIKEARRRKWPVATHLAETEGERQFLLRGTGNLFEFLARLGMIDSSVSIEGCKPVEFANRVGLFDGPCILAHVNYVDDEELKLLARSEATVVYCPRASEFFGRSGHRYPEMIAKGINVALGTDGLACNDSLSMFEEMRFLRTDARVDNYTILKMATLNGAKALGWGDRIGSLQPGKQADYVVVDMPAGAGDPLEALFTSEPQILQTVIAGKAVFTG